MERLEISTERKPQNRLFTDSNEGYLLEWTAPDGIERARMRSLQISDKGTVRGTH